jgi:hypothetical protein
LLRRIRHDVAEAWVNRDESRYNSKDIQYDSRFLFYLVNRLLLGKDVGVPFPPGLEDSKKTIYAHHMVGYARDNKE